MLFKTGLPKKISEQTSAYQNAAARDLTNTGEREKYYTHLSVFASAPRLF